MSHLLRSAVLLAIASFGAGCAQTSSATSSSRGVAVGPAPGTLLEEHVRYLASDELLGRDTGTQGSLDAAKYLADVMSAAGVEPAGDDGGWYQAMDITGRALVRPPAFIVTGPGVEPATGVHGETWYLMNGGAGVRNARIEVMKDSETIPDVAGDGPVALLIDIGDPGTAMRLARDRADELSAVADVILIAGPDRPGRTRPDPTHLVSVPGEPSQVLVRAGILERIRAGELEQVTLDLPTGEPIPAYNVLGRVPGVGTSERPELADEIVVFTAHYDHVGGVAGEGDEDRIYNGANDDASGVACVLELARAFAAGPPPARTMVFLLVTAEEQGLKGSRYFVEHPTLDLDQVTCNINFEMLGEPDAGAGGAGKVFLTGYPYSNLGPEWAAAGLPVVDDPYPEMQLFRRSDNYPFVQAGIIGQTISSGGEAEHYHKVSDEADTLDYDHMRRCFELSLTAAQMVASGALDPAWIEGQEPDEALGRGN